MFNKIKESKMRLKLMAVFVFVWCMLVGSTAWGAYEKSGLIYYPTNGAELIAMHNSVVARGLTAHYKLTNNGSGSTTAYALTSGVTFENYETLEFENGAMMVTTSGQTYVLNCVLDADPLQHVFDGGGSYTGNLQVPVFYAQWWGAKRDNGITDSTDAIKTVLALAKGADDTGIGRSAANFHLPDAGGGFYKITDTLVIDGTYGLNWYGDGTLTQREDSTRGQGGALRWYGSSPLPIIQVRGETSVNSNPNFKIQISDLTISGTSNYYSGGDTVPVSTAALAGIYIGNLDNVAFATLNRDVIIDNVSVRNARFGIYSGSPELKNTDHAVIKIQNSTFTHNFQAGIWWGTANAVGTVTDCAVGRNGWGSGSYALDDYAEKQAGANIYVTAGQLSIINYTPPGVTPHQPPDADGYQRSGMPPIIIAWSD